MQDESGAMAQIYGWAALAVLVGGPILLWIAGLLRRRKDEAPARAPFDARLAVNSTIHYALAFNVTFFIQELFLVIPKALTPGLRATLFHNNHSWEGADRIARLYQGTGALAIFVSGLLFFALLRASPRGPLRLFAFWMAYQGLLQALPQVASVPFAPQTDVGQAMTYLGFAPELKLALACIALVGIVAVGLALTRPALSFATDAAQLATPRTRTFFLLAFALIPAIVGGALIVPFRWPTSIHNLVAPQILIGWVGVSWMLASAWLHTDARAEGAPMRVSWLAIVALIALLAFFQIVLRPGVPFY